MFNVQAEGDIGMAKPIVQLWWAALIALSVTVAPMATAAPKPDAPKEAPYEHYAFGYLNGATPNPVSGGLLLMGGGDRNLDAMKWFFGKAGNGHIVVISASYGIEIGKEFYNDIGGIQSVEVFVFHGRSQASNPMILDKLRKADGIFIAGGDQARYVRFWRGTPVGDILNQHVRSGKPLAGTSAGLAIQGEKLYGAMDDGSLTSPDALADPLGPANTIEGNFLHFPLLKGVVTDTHFKERDRLGRLFAFLAKAQVGRAANQPAMIGLGVDESAAVAVEPNGNGRVYATAPDGYAWVVDGAALRHVSAKGPLTVAKIRVVGADGNSVIHLPSGTVDKPAFVRDYRALGGKVEQVTQGGAQ